MRHRERGHRPDELPLVPDQQDQREDEQQMVDPQQDMFDPEPEVGGDHPQPPLRRRHRESRRRRRKPLTFRISRRQLIAHQHIGRRQLQPLDPNLTPLQSARTDRHPLRHEGASVEPQALRLPRRAGLGQQRRDRHRAGPFRRHLPEHPPCIAPERLEVQKPGLQCVRPRRPRQRQNKPEHHQQPRHHGTCAVGNTTS